MKKRLRVVMLALCIAALFGILQMRLSWDKNTLLESRLVSEKQLDELRKGEFVLPTECVLRLNGAVLPYDSERKCYVLPQAPNESLRGVLTSEWGTIYLPKDEWKKIPRKAMRENQELSVFVSDGTRWTRQQVYLTGLPALSVHTVKSTPIYRDPAIYGETISRLGLKSNDSVYTMFWPKGNSRQWITQGQMEWHWRGNASLLADKKNYRINLLGKHGQSEKEDLLGLGEESNWILLAMSTDTTRTRDAVCWQLWDEVVQNGSGNDLGGMPSEYVEFYLDDEYMGVYRLCKPISDHSLQLNQQDRFYKWRKLYMMSDEELDKAEKEQSFELGNTVELVSPKTQAQNMWKPLKTYVNQFYRPQTETDLQTLQANTNLDNLIDVALFKQFVCGADNLFHNQCILWKDSEKKFYRIPWDLDYTFGNLYNDMYYLDETYTTHMDFTQLVLPDMELDTLWRADPEGTSQKVAKRWKELRATVFTAQNVADKMDVLIKQLEESGAWERDWKLWGNAETYPEPVQHFRTLNRDDTVKELRQRIRFLDEYMADYKPPSRELFDELPQ